MFQHDYNWRAICTDKLRTQVDRRTKYNVLAILENGCESIPPVSLGPSLLLTLETVKVTGILVFA